MAKNAQTKTSVAAGRQSSSGKLRPGSSAPPPQRRRPPSAWLSLGALIVVAAVWLAWSATHKAAAPAPAPTAAPWAGVYYPSQGHQGHLPGDKKRYANFRYSSDPPTSGFHQEVFTNAFVSQTPIARYIQVHLLEHGNVLLQYNCICPATVDALTRIAGEFDNRLLPPGTLTPSVADVQNAEEQGLAVVVAPYPGMKSAIAVTAWTRLGAMNTVDEAKIVSFINLYLHNQNNLNG